MLDGLCEDGLVQEATKLPDEKNVIDYKSHEDQSQKFIWVCEFEVWVLWVFKNDIVAGVIVMVGLWWWQKREKR